MKTSPIILPLMAALALAVSMTGALAAETKTLTGNLVCGKCTLHLTSDCQDVLQVEKNGKTVNYLLTQNKVSKDFHSNICKTSGEKVTVTGSVKEKDGKEILTATKIEPAP
jgi:hypothetical protein